MPTLCTCGPVMRPQAYDPSCPIDGVAALTASMARTLGAEALAAGAPRLVPQEILVGDEEAVGAGNGITNAAAWYAGWDAANLAASRDGEP